MITPTVGTVDEHPEWRALSDEEVVRKVRAGDAPLFEVLMRRYNQRLYRVARTILRDDTEAEDVMQHAYVEGYLHLGQFAGRAAFSTWLTQIAVYEALARVRRRDRERPADPLADADEDTMSTVKSSRPDPEQQALQGEARVLLESAIEALPTAYRSVFVLRDVEGMSTAETAECLDLSEEAVKTRLHRARALLRDELFERAGGRRLDGLLVPPVALRLRGRSSLRAAEDRDLTQGPLKGGPRPAWLIPGPDQSRFVAGAVPSGSSPRHSRTGISSSPRTEPGRCWRRSAP
jgi:RNA polymerase sigma-70 factor, ECF subfamily